MEKEKPSTWFGIETFTLLPKFLQTVGFKKTTPRLLAKTIHLC
jgi:hypothetical protein